MKISRFEDTPGSRTTPQEPLPAANGRPHQPEYEADGFGPEKRAGGPAPARPKGGRRWLPLLIVAALFGAGLMWRARQQPGAKTGAAGAEKGPGAGANIPTVKTVPVVVGNIVQTLALTGTLRSNQNIDLNSKISGRVARVLVQEGQRIRRGQLLIELDDEDLRAAVAGARAALQTAQVRYRQAVVGLPAREQQVRTTIQQAEVAVRTAQVRYRQALLSEPTRVQGAQAQVNEARQTVRTAAARLNQARVTARQVELQTAAEVRSAESAVAGAISSVAGAQAGTAQARAALAEIQRGAREQQIAQAQAQVNVVEAQLRDAETELNRARILFEGGAGPRSSVDTAQTRRDVTAAQLESARQNLSLVREGATTEEVRQAQETVRQAEERTSQARQGVRQAEAQLSQAQAGRSRVPVAQGEVTTALAALSQAQEGLRTAQSSLSQIPITREETRAARQAVEQAQATLGQARANRTDIPVAREDINAARAAVRSAQAQLQTAQVNLNYGRIASPIDGVVNEKLTDAGEAAAPGTALLRLVALDSVYFEAQVSENNVRRVRVGQPARVSVPAVSDQPLGAYVSDIIPVADPRFRQFRIRITIPRSQRELTPGVFARGTLTTQAINNTLVVPTDAVQSANGPPAVLVAVEAGEGAQIDRRLVKVGASEAGRTQLLGGVQRGEKIVVGNQPLEDGDKVRIAKTQ